MSFNVTVTPIVQEVEVNASVTPYEVDINVVDGQDLTLTTIGSSGVATYNPFTGLLNIPNYSTDLSGVVPTSRTLTINGVAFDLSANRAWTVPTHDAVTIGTANGLSLAGQVLSLGLASGSANGALSSTDWTTFNNKQNALINPVTGTGTSGQVAFWNGASTQTGSNNLFWDNVNGRLGIGTNAPTRTLDIFQASATVSVTPTANTQTVGFITNAIDNNVRGGFTTNLTTGEVRIGALGGAGFFPTLYANAVEGFRMFATTRNVLIQSGGAFTDAGFRLDVNGTARVQGALTVGTLIQSTGILDIINPTGGNDVRIGGSSGLVVRNNGMTMSTGGFTLNSSINIGDIFAWSRINNAGTLTGIKTGGSVSGYIFQPDVSGLTLNSPAVLTGFRNSITSVTGTGSVRMFWSFLNSGADRWNLYMEGTANNYLAGSLLIGTTTDEASSILTLASTTRGFLPPRMTTAQRDAIASPATGLVIYNISTNTHQGYNGTTWNNFY